MEPGGKRSPVLFILGSFGLYLSITGLFMTVFARPSPLLTIRRFEGMKISL